MLTVGDAAPKEDSSSSDGEGEEETDASAPQGTKKKRRNRKKGKSKKKAGGADTPTSTARDNSNLNPDATFFPNAAPPPKSRTVTPQPSGPQTAVQKLDALASKFHINFVPDCVQFLSHPPSDKAKRDFEHKKLTETILAQILIKLDSVETDGDQTARQQRKDLVREVQNMLNRLDEVVK